MSGRLREIASKIRTMDREARGDILAVVNQIRVVPYLQFGSNKVVLRAHIRLDPVGALPWGVRSSMDTLNRQNVPEFRSEFTVDLFEPSGAPRYAMAVFDLRQARMKFDDIAAKLQINHMAAKRAMHLAKKMQEAGITDPFVRLTGPPVNASRWRPNGRDGNRRKTGANSDVV